MLKHIRIIPLADESLGVRSMAIYIETPDVRLILDAGVSLAPRRYGLRPHPSEFRALYKARKNILYYSKKADIITVSHYHLDHYTPNFLSWYEWSSPEFFEEIYSNKIVFVKSISSNINFNQRKRGYAFIHNLEKTTDKVIEADNKIFEYGETKIIFSQPFPHGPENTKLGYVLLITVLLDKEKILYAPDVQGPISENVKKYILFTNPDVLVIGGPPLYLSGHKVREEDVTKGISNLKEIYLSIKKIVLSHHILRDLNWKDFVEKNGIDINNLELYSSILKREFTPLESLREFLYNSDPPSHEYMEWLEKKNKTEPPPIEL